MVEYKLIDLSKLRRRNPELSLYASRFVGETDARDCSARARLEDFVARLMGQGAKLLMAGEKQHKKFVPYGFRSYTVHVAGSFDDVSDVSRLFSKGDLYHSPELVHVRVSVACALAKLGIDDAAFEVMGPGSGQGDLVLRAHLKDYLPFSQYTHAGAYLIGHHIEVAERHRGHGFGRDLVLKSLRDERVELAEGFAVPTSISFWEKMGFQFPGLYCKELTVIASKS